MTLSSWRCLLALPPLLWFAAYTLSAIDTVVSGGAPALAASALLFGLIALPFVYIALRTSPTALTRAGWAFLLPSLLLALVTAMMSPALDVAIGLTLAGVIGASPIAAVLIGRGESGAQAASQP